MSSPVFLQCYSKLTIPGTQLELLTACPAALKRQRTVHDIGCGQPATTWGMHSPGQGTNQQPQAHGLSQSCPRQLHFQELESHGSHAQGTSDVAKGLITRSSSTGSRDWLSVAIPAAGVADLKQAEQRQD